jgi:predicted RNA-binding Zn ribbon-like protein
MTASSSQALESATIPAPASTLCLDYVNTLYWRGSDPKTETLTDAQALAGWLGKDGGLPAERAQAFSAFLADSPAKAKQVFGQAMALREALHRLFAARASNAAVADRDIALLNQALEEAPARDKLERTKDSLGWKVPREKISAPGLLAPVLWSATDLLLQGDAARIRQCANEKCRWVFVDSSKAGSRRWCTMSSCGNRAKAQRHYHKAKAKK